MSLSEHERRAIFARMLEERVKQEKEAFQAHSLLSPSRPVALARASSSPTKQQTPRSSKPSTNLSSPSMPQIERVPDDDAAPIPVTSPSVVPKPVVKLSEHEQYIERLLTSSANRKKKLLSITSSNDATLKPTPKQEDERCELEIKPEPSMTISNVDIPVPALEPMPAAQPLILTPEPIIIKPEPEEAAPPKEEKTKEEPKPEPQSPQQPMPLPSPPQPEKKPQQKKTSSPSIFKKPKNLAQLVGASRRVIAENMAGYHAEALTIRDRHLLAMEQKKKIELDQSDANDASEHEEVSQENDIEENEAEEQDEENEEANLNEAASSSAPTFDPNAEAEEEIEATSMRMKLKGKSLLAKMRQESHKKLQLLEEEKRRREEQKREEAALAAQKQREKEEKALTRKLKRLEEEQLKGKLLPENTRHLSLSSSTKKPTATGAAVARPSMSPSPPKSARIESPVKRTSGLRVRQNNSQIPSSPEPQPPIAKSPSVDSPSVSLPESLSSSLEPLVAVPVAQKTQPEEQELPSSSISIPAPIPSSRLQVAASASSSVFLPSKTSPKRSPPSKRNSSTKTVASPPPATASPVPVVTTIPTLSLINLAELPREEVTPKLPLAEAAAAAALPVSANRDFLPPSSSSSSSEKEHLTVESLDDFPMASPRSIEDNTKPERRPSITSNPSSASASVSTSRDNKEKKIASKTVPLDPSDPKVAEYLSSVIATVQSRRSSASSSSAAIASASLSSNDKNNNNSNRKESLEEIAKAALHANGLFGLKQVKKPLPQAFSLVKQQHIQQRVNSSPSPSLSSASSEQSLYYYADTLQSSQVRKEQSASPAQSKSSPPRSAPSSSSSPSKSRNPISVSLASAPSSASIPPKQQQQPQIPAAQPSQPQPVIRPSLSPTKRSPSKSPQKRNHSIAPPKTSGMRLYANKAAMIAAFTARLQNTPLPPPSAAATLPVTPISAPAVSSSSAKPHPSSGPRSNTKPPTVASSPSAPQPQKVAKAPPPPSVQSVQSPPPPPPSQSTPRIPVAASNSAKLQASRMVSPPRLSAPISSSSAPVSAPGRSPASVAVPLSSSASSSEFYSPPIPSARIKLFASPSSAVVPSPVTIATISSFHKSQQDLLPSPLSSARSPPLQSSSKPKLTPRQAFVSPPKKMPQTAEVSRPNNAPPNAYHVHGETDSSEDERDDSGPEDFNNSNIASLTPLLEALQSHFPPGDNRFHLHPSLSFAALASRAASEHALISRENSDYSGSPVPRAPFQLDLDRLEHSLSQQPKKQLPLNHAAFISSVPFLANRVLPSVAESVEPRRSTWRSDRLHLELEDVEDVESLQDDGYYYDEPEEEEVGKNLDAGYVPDQTNIPVDVDDEQARFAVAAMVSRHLHRGAL